MTSSLEEGRFLERLGARGTFRTTPLARRGILLSLAFLPWVCDTCRVSAVRFGAVTARCATVRAVPVFGLDRVSSVLQYTVAERHGSYFGSWEKLSPDPPILLFWISLPFVFAISFLVCFPFLPQASEGFHDPCYFGGFPCFCLSKNTGVEGSGNSRDFGSSFGSWETVPTFPVLFQFGNSTQKNVRNPTTTTPPICIAVLRCP